MILYPEVERVRSALLILSAVQQHRGQVLEASEKIEAEANRLKHLIQQWVEENAAAES